LIEAVVFAARIADALMVGGDPSATSDALCEAAGETDVHESSSDAGICRALREAMSANCGVERDATGLTSLLRMLREFRAEATAGSKLADMADAATLVAVAALGRKESRGAHMRSDHPKPRPELCQPTLLRLNEAKSAIGAL